jgi:hypothetical protein
MFIKLFYDKEITISSLTCGLHFFRIKYTSNKGITIAITIINIWKSDDKDLPIAISTNACTKNNGTADPIAGIGGIY